MPLSLNTYNPLISRSDVNGILTTFVFAFFDGRRRMRFQTLNWCGVYQYFLITLLVLLTLAVILFTIQSDVSGSSGVYVSFVINFLSTNLCSNTTLSHTYSLTKSPCNT